ncbi:hypothetical protein [Streptomyces sp. NPDC002172]
MHTRVPGHWFLARRGDQDRIGSWDQWPPALSSPSPITRWGEADLVPRLREAVTALVRLDRAHRI